MPTRQKTPFSQDQLHQICTSIGPHLILPENKYKMNKIVATKAQLFAATDNYLRRYYVRLQEIIHSSGMAPNNYYPAFTPKLKDGPKNKARQGFGAQLVILSDFGSTWQGLPLCSRIHQHFSIPLKNDYRKNQLLLDAHNQKTNITKSGSRPCNKIHCLACAEHNAKHLAQIWTTVATPIGEGHQVSVFVKKGSARDQVDGITADLQLGSLEGRKDPEIPIIARGVQLRLDDDRKLISQRYFITPVAKKKQHYLGYDNHQTLNKAKAMQMFYPSATVMAAAHAGVKYANVTVVESLLSSNLRNSTAALFGKIL